jgi:hypothetical protein
MANWKGLRWVEVLVWIGAAIAAWQFWRVWTAPGRCNSDGRAFDYDAWACGDAIHYQFRNVPAYAHSAFWWLIVALVLAILVKLIRRRHAP